MSKRPRREPEPEESGSSSDESASETSSETSENPPAKYALLESPEASTSILCQLAPHREPLEFATVDEYELHYAKEHVNRCSDCHRNFPSSYFLDLHISEHHDPLNQVRRSKGEKIYRCLIEDCDPSRRFSTRYRRQMHLIAKHGYPKDYDFSIIRTGIDRKSTMLRMPREKRRTSIGQQTYVEERAKQRLSITSEKPEKPSENNESKASPSSRTTTDQEMKDLESSMSALRFVPPKIRFGHKGKGSLPQKR